MRLLTTPASEPRVAGHPSLIRPFLAGTLLVLALVGIVIEATAQAPPSDNPAVNEAVGAGLQGDVARALRALNARPAADFSGSDADYRACMLERFGQGPRVVENATGFVREAVQAFRTYWHRSLLDPPTRASHEDELARVIAKALGVAVDRSPTMDELEALAIARLRESGHYALMGRTGALRELMVWRKQEARSYRVKLPEGEHDTCVEILDDFVTLGWGDYATCGRRGAGGWATADTLFAVRPRYASLDSEEFRVTFLGHETQHFADLVRFAPMEPWELEYRAKLVELAQASSTRGRIVAKFTEDQSDDPGSPHSYANKRVMAALRASLGSEASDLNAVPLDVLHNAAVELLAEDSSRRLRR
jgi:hypothetical protein